MANNQTVGRRWESYRPSKGIWFWSCVACVAATIVIGFGWGGWVTGGNRDTVGNRRGRWSQCTNGGGGLRCPASRMALMQFPHNLPH